MKVSDFNGNVLFRNWRGQVTPDATWRPYVISEAVPQGWRWKILAASLFSTFGTNEAVWLFAIPPQLAKLIQNQTIGPADGSFFAPTTGGGLHNEPPLKGAVLLSEGGNTGNNDIGSGFGGLSNDSSINVAIRRNRAFKKFELDSGWALLGFQASNGGGGTGQMVLSAMILQKHFADVPPDVVQPAAPIAPAFYFAKVYAATP